METQLLIYQYNVSGQAVNSFEVDLYDDVPIQINKSIIDIKQPEQRKSEYSQSIRTPGTANNRRIFNEIDNLNRATINSSSVQFNPDFNVNLKADAVLLKKGIPLLTGYVQLTEIPINDGQVEYEFIIIGRFANLFQDLGDSKLNEIDLSEYDHQWTTPIIASSWSNYVIKNGTSYPNFDASGNPTGEGYVYPLIDNGRSDGNAEMTYKIEETMFPAIYVKQIIDSMFLQAGYRYESEFFNSLRFKRLIVPFTGGEFRLTEQEVTDRQFIVSNNSDLNYNTTGVFFSDLKTYEFDNTIQDTSPPGVNLGAYEVDITSGNSGKYIHSFTGVVKIANTSGATFGVVTNELIIDIVRVSGGSRFTLGSLQIHTNMNSVINGGYINVAFTVYADITTLLVGDSVHCEFIWFNRGAIAADTEINILAGSEFKNIADASYFEGNTINLSAALSAKIKQADFLIWLVRAFNLYIVPDKIDQKKLIIEPRDDFYTSTTIDLTDYLDVSKEVLVKPMGVLDFRTFILQYTEDNDEYNSKYQNLFREQYATTRQDINNDFIKNANETTLGFSATPLSDSSTNDRAYSKIRPIDPNTTDNQKPAYNIRLLQYGGLVDTDYGWNLSGVSGITNYPVDFPYAGMLDNVYNPTFSLDCSMPKAVYYGNFSGGVTFYNGNLYNLYWKKTIDEITDKDSKLVTAYFKLSDNQIANLDFRNIYQVDKQFYRLYSVEVDLNANEPAKIELLKLKTASTFIPCSGIGNGGSGGVLGDEELPMLIRNDNSKYFKGLDSVKTFVKTSSESTVYIDFTQSVWALDHTDTAILCDANTKIPSGGTPFIVVKNTNGGHIDLYGIKGQTVEGDDTYTLNHNDIVWLLPFNGNWIIISKTNTT
jgi:hypothetical protein